MRPLEVAEVVGAGLIVAGLAFLAVWAALIAAGGFILAACRTVELRGVR